MMVEGRDFTTGDLVRLAGLRAKQRGQACAIWRNVWRSLAEHAVFAQPLEGNRRI